MKTYYIYDSDKKTYTGFVNLFDGMSLDPQKKKTDIQPPYPDSPFRLQLFNEASQTWTAS